MTAANEHELEILSFELEQAREDDRDASNQFWQATAVGVAALAFILAFYSELIGGSNRQKVPSYFYIILVLSVSIATFSYATAVSMRSTVRYQYIRQLEYRIRRITKVDTLRWKQLIAPVETLNIRHINNPITLAHFLNIFFAVLFTIISCILIIILFCNDLPDISTIAISLLIYLPFGALFICTAWFSSSKSLPIYKFAEEQAKKRIELELRGKEYLPNLKISPWYFVYPRPGDCQKALFILLGMVSYIAFCDKYGFKLNQYIFPVITCFIVFDILVYQARYQWNDLREVSEDDRHPRAGYRRRLASTGLPAVYAVRVSLIIIIYKLLLAMAILFYNRDTFGWPLGILCLLVFITALPYEIARAKNDSNAIIAFVPFGYILRFLAGFAL